ncbi:MAG: nitrite/sulfite reductase [Acidobacteria bacterium]|nr:nitrite/sulfite reductase [Acidobacteriota bacterium]
MSDVERIKAERGLNGGLTEAFRDFERPDIEEDLEQVAKSHGIYMQFNRAQSGREKDWMYMIRLAVPGGGPLSYNQWQLLDDLARKHAINPQGEASLRLTTRQAIQFHWVDKPGVLAIVKAAAESGLRSLNACGDNVRNVMSCPLAHRGPFPANDVARDLAQWFELPLAPFIEVFAIDPNAVEDSGPRFDYGPQLLNRKFKIGVGAITRQGDELVLDNCVEVRTHDLGFTPDLESHGERVWVWVGGGQGEKLGKSTASMLALPLARIDRGQLRQVANAIVGVHRDWGNREQRHHARLKYLIRSQGIEWFRKQVSDRSGIRLGSLRGLPDVGARHLHHGWMRHGEQLDFGMFVENGRLIDSSPNGQLLRLVGQLLASFPVSVSITANQDLVFHGVPNQATRDFESLLVVHGYGQRYGQPYSRLRLQSGACVGRDTCRLAYTDSEKFEPQLIDELEALGWGDLVTSIGVTGCERQCFRPGTKAIGLVGSGLNRYQFKFGGTEDGRHQGRPLRLEGKEYLRSVPKERVTQLLNLLFQAYRKSAVDGESLGTFNRRLGTSGLVELFSGHGDTADLMAKTVPYKEYEHEFEHRVTAAR